MTSSGHFTPLSRALHWLMAVLLVAMLFIGAGMVASISGRHTWLLALHRPLGLALLLLAVVRLIHRLRHPPPPLPTTVSSLERLAVKLTNALFYGLMLVLPLVGWAMLSAAGEPIVVYGSVRLPPLLSQDAARFALLRQAHTVLAYLLFTMFLMHLGAVLFHALVHRDGVFSSMAFGASRRSAPSHPPGVHARQLPDEAASPAKSTRR
jgi:cytochrome b561